MQRWGQRYTRQGCASPDQKNWVFQRKPSKIFFDRPLAWVPLQPILLGIIKFETVKVISQFEKTYIGKGTQVKDLDIIRVSISKETLEEILKDQMVDYDGNEYLVFEVASLKELDQYGKTHTAYISKKLAAHRGKKSFKKFYLAKAIQ